MSEGRKDDAGKIQPSIVLGDFSRALTEVCKAGETGIQRYGPSDWLKVPEARKRYEDALLRHWLSSKTERLDQDSQLLHLAHTAWNALAVLELELRRLEQQEAPSHITDIEKVSESTMDHARVFIGGAKIIEDSLKERLSEEDKIEIQKENRRMLEKKVVELEQEIANRSTKP